MGRKQCVWSEISKDENDCLRAALARTGRVGVVGEGVMSTVFLESILARCLSI